MEPAPFRLIGFVFGLFLLPSIVPLYTRIALGAALLLLCAPLFAVAGSGYAADSPAGLAFLLLSAASAGSFNPGSVISEGGIGFTFGVLLSIAAGAMSLIASYSGATMFPSLAKRAGQFGWQNSSLQQFDRIRIELLLSLLFAVSIIESGALERVILVIGSSYSFFPPPGLNGAAAISAQGSMIGLLFELVDAALLVALCSAAPFLFLLLFSELTGFVLKRYVPAVSHSGLIETLRIPLILLLFGTTAAMLLSQLHVFQDISVDRIESYASGGR